MTALEEALRKVRNGEALTAEESQTLRATVDALALFAMTALNMLTEALAQMVATLQPLLEEWNRDRG